MIFWIMGVEMPDITMCINESCRRKHSCYRYTAIPNPHGWQAYACFDCEADEDFLEEVKENDVCNRE